jgi:PHS family inorganic phosphate transporter-like MFS transporter
VSRLGTHTLTSGVGFYVDAFDIFSISIAATMIGYVYHQGGSNTSNQDLGVKVSHSVGTFVGQLLFGWLGDVVGRKKMYGIELVSRLDHPYVLEAVRSARLR